MIYLIIMQCVLLDCKHIEVVEAFKTMQACEQAMEERYPDIEPGRALMCVRYETERIKT